MAQAGRSLNAKLILAFLLVTIPSLAILGGISFYALRDLTIANRQLQEISRSLEAVRGLEKAVGRALMPLNEFLVFPAPGQDRRFAALMGEIEVRAQGCGNTACHGASGQPREMARGLVPYFRGIRDRASSMFDGGARNRNMDEIRLVQEINHQGEEVSRQLERMSSALLVRVESLQEKSQEVYRRAWTFIVASLVIVGGLAVVTAWFLSRQLIRPIHALVSGTRHVMEGDLEYRVAVTEADEIGELTRSFNAMAEEIEQHRGRLEVLVQTRTAELEQAHDSLVRSEKLASIGLLASGVAHELNNPLTSILMNINLLMEEVQDKPDLHRELKRVSDDTLRCQRIIDGLRDFSRPHALETRPCNINDVVNDVLGFAGRQMQLQQIALVRKLFAQMPSISCDPDRIRQVLMNILVNAVQAMPEGGTLIVGTALQDGFAAITVTDSGPGIPGEIRSKIFDPFFTTKPEGTGLGLSIVFGIMEEHGGSVEIENVTAGGETAASGTAVRLLLPTGSEPLAGRRQQPAAEQEP